MMDEVASAMDTPGLDAPAIGTPGLTLEPEPERAPLETPERLEPFAPPRNVSNGQGDWLPEVEGDTRAERPRADGRHQSRILQPGGLMSRRTRTDASTSQWQTRETVESRRYSHRERARTTSGGRTGGTGMFLGRGAAADSGATALPSQPSSDASADDEAGQPGQYVRSRGGKVSDQLS